MNEDVIQVCINILAITFSIILCEKKMTKISQYLMKE